MQHVPFGQLPMAQPGSLSYGFGLSPASVWGNPSTSSSPSPSFCPSPTPPSAASTSGKRRQRSPSPSPIEDDQPSPKKSAAAASAGGGGVQWGAMAGSKRVRLESAPASSSSTPAAINNLPKRDISLTTSSNPATELNKSLSSLSHPQLLSLLTTLLSSQPSLHPLVKSLLPPPTSSSIISRLEELERSVLSALPQGSSTARPDYVWGRVRSKVLQYAEEVSEWLQKWNNTPTATLGGPPSLPAEDLHHPATLFVLLSTLTLSLSRLFLSLPSPPPPTSPLQNLLPQLLAVWDTLFRRVHGKVLSAEMVRGWFDKAEIMTNGGIGIIGVNVGAPVRERMRNELGWLVGWNQPGGLTGASSERMEEEEL